MKSDKESETNKTGIQRRGQWRLNNGVDVKSVPLIDYHFRVARSILKFNLSPIDVIISNIIR